MWLIEPIISILTSFLVSVYTNNYIFLSKLDNIKKLHNPVESISEAQELLREFMCLYRENEKEFASEDGIENAFAVFREMLPQNLHASSADDVKSFLNVSWLW